MPKVHIMVLEIKNMLNNSQRNKYHLRSLFIFPGAIIKTSPTETLLSPEHVSLRRWLFVQTVLSSLVVTILLVNFFIIVIAYTREASWENKDLSWFLVQGVKSITTGSCVVRAILSRQGWACHYVPSRKLDQAITKLYHPEVSSSQDLLLISKSLLL